MLNTTLIKLTFEHCVTFSVAKKKNLPMVECSGGSYITNFMVLKSINHPLKNIRFVLSFLGPNEFVFNGSTTQGMLQVRNHILNIISHT